MATRARLIQWFADWKTGNWGGEQTPNDMLAEWRNTKTAEVDAGGGLWVANPQEGHWLNDESAADFVAWLETQGAISDE